MAVPLILQGDSINSYDEPTLRAAADRLKAATKANGIRYVSDKKIRDALESGEAWAALCYSGDAAWVAEDCPEVSYFFAKEGASLWLDTMGISEEAEHVDEAYAFINFLLEPEIAAMSANSLWYATPNRLALPLLDEELVSNSLKYAFPDGRQGHIAVSLKQTDNDGGYVLDLSDDGVGLAAEESAGGDRGNSESLGLKLVEMLADQLDGEAQISSGEQGGVSARVKFSESEYLGRL